MTFEPDSMCPADVAASLLGLSIVPTGPWIRRRGFVTPALMGRSGNSVRIRSPTIQPRSPARVALEKLFSCGGESLTSTTSSSPRTVTVTDRRCRRSSPWPSYSTQSTAWYAPSGSPLIRRRASSSVSRMFVAAYSWTVPIPYRSTTSAKRSVAVLLAATQLRRSLKDCGTRTFAR